MDKIDISRLFNNINNLKIGVIGDFFLDKYLIIDNKLDEPSIETKLMAYQVINTRQYPGASGTICNNLAALGVGNIYAVGFVGNDGNGFELKKELDKIKIKRDYLFETDKMVTPTYIKPMMLKDGYEVESNRQDIKNFKNTDIEIENKIINCLDEVFNICDGIIILDQMVENNFGVITSKIRKKLIELGNKYSNKIVFADSRARIKLFENIFIKCNDFEICEAFNIKIDKKPNISDVFKCGIKMYEQNKKTIFVTMGKEGVMVFNKNGIYTIPTIKVEEPYDICGAGDSVTATIVSLLTLGAKDEQAAFIGNIVASITIRKIGVTGTANITEVLKAYDDYFYNIEYVKEKRK